MANCTKGTWRALLGGTNHKIIVGGGDSVIAELQLSNPDLPANAEIICSAVNACIDINPGNPQAAAEAIKSMYDALKVAIEDDPWMVMPTETRIIINQALAKAGGKLCEREK
jgi:hypothetical protein